MVDIERNRQRLEWFTTDELLAEVNRRMETSTAYNTGEPYRCGACGLPFDGSIHWCAGRAGSSGEIEFIDRSRGTV